MAAAALAAAALLPHAQAEPQVSIIMEKDVFGYCEKLFYTIEVSEVTGEAAIVHIRDDSGRGSSAIPIPIAAQQTPVPSLIPFGEEIFETGRYHVDVEYAGQAASAEFELRDLGLKCIPAAVRPIVANWYHGVISDGFLIDAIQRLVDGEVISVPFEISEENIYSVHVPDWVRSAAQWWLSEEISDSEFAGVINYLIREQVISASPGSRGGI